MIDEGTNWAIRQQPYLPWSVFNYLAEDAAKGEKETMLHLELMAQLCNRNNNGIALEHLVKERKIEYACEYSSSESGESNDLSDSDHEGWQNHIDFTEIQW
jgi:hypothetical protein